MSRLDEKERKYAQNPRTHIDFVVYHKMDKKPHLAIEIDGYAFHNAKNTQSKRDELKNAILAKYDFTLLATKHDRQWRGGARYKRTS